jgi:hypothetical protein
VEFHNQPLASAGSFLLTTPARALPQRRRSLNQSRSNNQGLFSRIHCSTHRTCYVAQTNLPGPAVPVGVESGCVSTANSDRCCLPTSTNERARATQEALGGGAYPRLAVRVASPKALGVPTLGARLRTATGNLGNPHLPGHDPYYG